jgi:uroporphyrinogen decarboxylase
MNSKERILTTINHEEPDKVPLDSWISKEVEEEIIKGLNLDIKSDPFILGKTLGDDLLYLNLGFCDGFSSIFKEERKISKNLYQDPFGIKWRKKSHQYGSYCEFAEHPLADLKDYDKYRFPDPFQIHKKEFEDYEKLIESDGSNYGILGGVACTMFEASWYLRGLENFLIDLYKRKDFATELLDETMKYSLVISKKLVEMGVDIIWWGDDISDERGPYLNPKLYRELIKPRYAYMAGEVKRLNKDIKIAYHTDGNIGWVLDDLIEIGIDILNPLQPDVNNVAKIKKRYGKKLTFWGNVDTRNIMSNGSFKDVAKEIRNVLSVLSPGGGHILCTNHRIQATSRAVDNTIAYYWIANKLRDYPLDNI